MNSKQRGDVGVGAAIAWFTSHGHTVSIPLTDSQSYDLVIDAGELLRVQVKTTTCKENRWEVGLRTCGGNRSGTGKSKVMSTTVDLLFVLRGDGAMYLIPAAGIAGVSSICLNAPKWQQFKVDFSTLL